MKRNMPGAKKYHNCDMKVKMFPKRLNKKNCENKHRKSQPRKKKPGEIKTTNSLVLPESCFPTPIGIQVVKLGRR
jgi:hypothetical protein